MYPLRVSLSFHSTLPTCVFTPFPPASPSSSGGVPQPADSPQERTTRAGDVLAPDQAVFHSSLPVLLWEIGESLPVFLFGFFYLNQKF